MILFLVWDSELVTWSGQCSLLNLLLLFCLNNVCCDLMKRQLLDLFVVRSDYFRQYLSFNLFFCVGFWIFKG